MLLKSKLRTKNSIPKESNKRFNSIDTKFGQHIRKDCRN